MSTIKANDRVKVVVGTRYYDILGNQIGQVLRTYDFADGVAIVEFPEGMTVKIAIDDLVKIEVKPQETEEAKVEIPEGVKRITEEEFRKAVIEVTSDFAANNGGFMRGATGVIMGANISSKLFKSQDSVVMTKDELIVTLWDGCNPVNVSESTGGEMPLDKSLSVSISGIISLRKIADILFDDESENA